MADNADNAEIKKVNPILKQLGKLGVKPNKHRYVNVIRIILFLIVVGYVIYMIYDDYNDQQKNKELVQSMFKDDDKFYKKLVNMNDKVRNTYLKAIRQSLDESNTTQSKLYNKLKSSVIVAMVSEFILSGDHIESISGLGQSILSSGINTIL